MWGKLGQSYRCSVIKCSDSMPYGSKVWVEKDGTVLCGSCHSARFVPEEEPAPLRSCIICDDPMEGKPDSQLCCSRKCAGALAWRNTRAAKRASAEADATS